MLQNTGIMHCLFRSGLLSEMQGLYQVFTVADSNKLDLKLINLGPQYNMSYIVESGTERGDRIVIGGTQMLRSGRVITSCHENMVS